MKQFCFGRLKGKDRKKTDNGRGQGCGDGRRNLRGCIVDQPYQGLSTNTFVFRELEMSYYILHENDPHVDHYTYGNCNSRQRDNVGIDPRVAHNDKRRQYGKGQYTGNQQRSPKVKDQHDHHNNADEHFVRQCAFQRTHRLMNKLGAIVKGYYCKLAHGTVLQFPLRETYGNFLDLFFHTIDYGEGIRSITRHHYASDHFRAFLVEHTPALGRSQRHYSNVLYAYRHIVFHRHHRLFKVLYGLDVPQAPYQVFSAVDLYGIGAGITVRILHRHHHLVDTDIVSLEGGRIDIDLILLHKATN